MPPKLYVLNESLPGKPAVLSCKLDDSNDIVEPHGVLVCAKGDDREKSLDIILYFIM